MGLIGEPIALMDIGNCEAFVQRTIDKSGIEYGPQEREELLAEGLCLLYELASKYDPGVGGRDASKSRFSGYAAMFLPRRLGDSWHRNHPEHRYVTDPQTGKRGWSYSAPMLSLDGLTDGPDTEQRGPDRRLLNAKGINAFCHATRAKLRVPSVASSQLAR